jgi:hypothetical protein
VLGEAGASLLAQQTQHGYYRQTRERLKALEAALRLPEDLKVQTTLGMGSTRGRRVSVHQMAQVLLAVIGLVDLGAAAFAFKMAL